MSIYGLINDIDNGEIVLPAIQRDFVWDEDRIELLFDSMFRGYPVGIVLLWETYHQIQFRPFARDHVPGGIHQFEENKKSRPIKLVLDGQQRLSSIYVALKGTFASRKLYYDVLSGRDAGADDKMLNDGGGQNSFALADLADLVTKLDIERPRAIRRN
jgi:uncharacterized protein with ParB-like and HNH nuclease domain